jgi:glycosidase
MMTRLWHSFRLLLLLCPVGLNAQKPSITKVDPPNWWASMPKPMLLVRGEGLGGATFSVSDAAVQVERTAVSENGHWAQVWLSAAPAVAETVTLRAVHGAEHVEVPYTFAPRRETADGFAGFSSRDVLYLIMTDRFADGDLKNDGAGAKSGANSVDAAAERAKPRGWHGGDLRGIEQHLDYLQQLGVTTVWTTPVYQNHGDESYHGYGATDLYSVDEHYGSLEDLRSLAAALHRRGMKLVLDTVPNHVGPANPWVKDEPMPDWFHGTKADHLKAESNFKALIDPHAPWRDKVGTLDGWFGDTLPDMNTENPAVAQYLRQNAVWWIEQTGADGLRIDTFPYVNREFWHGFNGELKELYPRLTEVGEAFNGDPVIVSSFAGGVTRAGVDTELTTPFDFPTYFALREVFGKGAPLSKLADVLAKDPLYPHPEALVPFVGNHDTVRFMDAAQGKDEGAREAALALAFAYIFTTRGMPQVYSGDEIAMHGGEDPDNRHDFPGGFPGQPANEDAFTAKGRSAGQQLMFAWVSRLAQLRRTHPALACGAQQVLGSGNDWLVYLRYAQPGRDDACLGAAPAKGGDRELVVLHRGAESKLDVNLADTGMSGCALGAPELGAKDATATISGGKLHLAMQGEDVLLMPCR